MNTKQLTWPTIQEQKQFWINKEAHSNNVTNETREAIAKIVEDYDGLINYIVRNEYPEIAIWPHTRVRRAIRNAIDQGIQAFLCVSPQISNGNASTTADPKPKYDLSRTESACEFYDDQETRYRLRDEGRNDDGSGESYGGRNV